nr:alpha-L-arabinofuranosidase C-terminal domain-containing protein [Sphingomonas insulae]
MRSRQPEGQIEKAIKVIADNGFAGKIKIAFDEWNLRSWHHPGFPGGGADRVDLIGMRDENDQNATYTMADALFSASFLNGCLRHADVVEMACMAPVINVRGPLFVHPKGVVKRTTFHVMQMYSDLLQPHVVATHIAAAPLASDGASVPQIDAITTVSDDGGKMAIAIINRHPTQGARLRIAGVGGRQGRLDILDGDSPDAFNDVARPSRVTPRQITADVSKGTVMVTPHSLSILSLTI